QCVDAALLSQTAKPLALALGEQPLTIRRQVGGGEVERRHQHRSELLLRYRRVGGYLGGSSEQTHNPDAEDDRPPTPNKPPTNAKKPAASGFPPALYNAASSQLTRNRAPARRLSFSRYAR